MEQAYWDRVFIECSMWDREAGMLAVPGVGDFIRSRLPEGYWVRSKVNEKDMQVRYTIRTSPPDTVDSDVPIVEIAEAIADNIPKMFPGLFIKISSGVIEQHEGDEE